MANLQNIEVWAVALVLTVALLLGFAGFARWCGFGTAVPKAKLNQLQLGMTHEEVLRLLGEPRERRKGKSGREQWLYGAGMQRHVLLTEFSNEGRLSSFAHGVPHPSAPVPPPPES